MVKNVLHHCIHLIFLFVCTSGYAFLSEDIKVTSEIDSDKAFENQPISGTIMVTHDSQASVDTASFLLAGKTPLKVQHIQDIKISSESPLMISMYSFDLPPQEKGLYVLPRIRVKVGGKAYESISSSYEVHGGVPAPVQVSPSPRIPTPPPPPQRVPSTPSRSSQTLPPVSPLLKLEAFVQGKSSLFPGERTLLVYRYTFNTDVELRKEELPMLDAKGLRKVGSKQIRDQSSGDLSTREIIQEVEAVNPGEFTFGPSVIEGYALARDGQKKLLSSQAPPVVIKVQAIPAEAKPKSFNGMIGDFTMTVALDTPSPVQVGDKVKLSVQVTGKGDFSTVKLPELCCIPGMEGLFSQNDLAEPGQIQGDKVLFKVELRPLTPLVHEIPSIEYSSFNPATQKYIIRHTQAIPLAVKEVEAAPEEPLQGRKKEENTQQGWDVSGAKLQPVEIQRNEQLQQEDLENKRFGTWWALALIPIGCALLLLQLNYIKHLTQKEVETHIKTSLAVLEEAQQKRTDPDRCYALLSLALRMRLAESGKIQSAEIVPEALVKEGIVGEVRAFLIKIERSRFAQEQEENVDQLLAQGSALYGKIGIDG
jgi:hypothetical protein